MTNIITFPTKQRDDFLKDVVSDLVKLRKQRQLTQEELNYRIGVADRLVSKWECGVRTPTSFNLYCWADALDSKLKIIANDNLPSSPNEQKLKPVNDNHSIRVLTKSA